MNKSDEFVLLTFDTAEDLSLNLIGKFAEKCPNMTPAESAALSPGFSMLCSIAMAECAASYMQKLLKERGYPDEFLRDFLKAIKRMQKSEQFAGFLQAHSAMYQEFQAGVKK